MPLHFYPLGTKVLLEQLDPPTQTPTGIYIPESAKEKSNRARVVAVGEGKRFVDGLPVSLTLKVGDTVLFDQYIGKQIKLEDKVYLVMDESNILGVVKEE